MVASDVVALLAVMLLAMGPTLAAMVFLVRAETRRRVYLVEREAGIDPEEVR